MTTIKELEKVLVGSKEYLELKAENEKLKDLFRGLERVTDIWLPNTICTETKGEVIALHNFRSSYLEILNGTSSTIESVES